MNRNNIIHETVSKIIKNVLVDASTSNDGLLFLNELLKINLSTLLTPSGADAVFTARAATQQIQDVALDMVVEFNVMLMLHDINLKEVQERIEEIMTEISASTSLRDMVPMLKIKQLDRTTTTLFLLRMYGLQVMNENYHD